MSQLIWFLRYQINSNQSAAPSWTRTRILAKRQRKHWLVCRVTYVAWHFRPVKRMHTWCFSIGCKLQIRHPTFRWLQIWFSKLPEFVFFDRYPDYTPILIRAVELWAHDPQVTTPVLKLFAELVQNRSQRLQFDISSPNGILLFREASKVICAYGTHRSPRNSLQFAQKYFLYFLHSWQAIG